MKLFGNVFGDSNDCPKVIVSGPWVTVLIHSLVSSGPSSSHTLLRKVSLFPWYGYLGFSSSGVPYVLLVSI